MWLLLACFDPGPAPTQLILPLAERESPTLVRDLVLPTPPEAEAMDAADPDAPLVINELVTVNQSTWDDGSGTFPDWIELYNRGEEPIELSRIWLRDDSGWTWQGQAGTLVAGARLLLIADGTNTGLHLPFALDGEGDTLSLGLDGVVVDRIATGAMPGDVAWARFPDGGAWAPTIAVTPNASNGDDPGTSLDPSDRLFQLDSLNTFRITLSEEAKASLYADRLSYVEGSLTVDEGTYAQVGVRLKAYVGSSRTLDQKCAFKVDLNRYDDQRYRGMEVITLNNMVQDYTYIHEYLAYRIYRAAGIPAPRLAYAQVYVNEEYYGLYAVVESIDDTFLARWYEDNTGALYEGAYGVDFYTGYEWYFEYDEGPENNDRSDLSAVIAVLNGAADDAGIAALEELVDVDEFLLNMAIEAHILHWDGYTTSNNYRIYHDPVSDRFQIIPWGTDQTFVNFYYGPYSGGGEVFEFCLRNEACLARYNQKLIEVADLIESLPLEEEGDDILTWLNPEIQSDPRREFGITTWSAYVAATWDTLSWYPAYLRTTAGGE